MAVLGWLRHKWQDILRVRAFERELRSRTPMSDDAFASAVGNDVGRSAAEVVRRLLAQNLEVHGGLADRIYPNDPLDLLGFDELSDTDDICAHFRLDPKALA